MLLITFIVSDCPGNEGEVVVLAAVEPSSRTPSSLGRVGRSSSSGSRRNDTNVDSPTSSGSVHLLFFNMGLSCWPLFASIFSLFLIHCKIVRLQFINFTAVNGDRKQ